MNDELYVKAFIGQTAFLTLNRALIKELGLYETAVLALLIDRYNVISDKEDGWFYTVREYMQSELKLGRTPIDNAILSLENKELIHSKRSGLPSKKYYFIDWTNIRIMMETSVNSSMPIFDNQECRKSANMSVENQPLNNKKENKENNNPLLSPYGDLSFVAPEFLPIVTEWLEYKKQKRQTYTTAIGLRKMYNNLYQMSGGDPDVASQIVSQSIGNNYSGLFPLKTNLTTTDGNTSILDTIAGAERLYRKGFV